MTDIQFIIPLATEIQNKQGWPLYIYINKYINKKLIPSEIKIKKNFHDNDHRYVFRNPYSDFTYDENDLKMEALMTDFISNFVIYGQVLFENLKEFFYRGVSTWIDFRIETGDG
ncbi:unnamed protein product [Meloidogyne enterolobii]|uniref:Uncharacterized protein n=1 Tax=Meloidogyne enterolobii TaxID=390850 RepID=A0ACB0YVQ6_MELEN